MRIFEFKPNENTDAVVTAYIHSPITEMNEYRTKYPSVVVCPGGGYEFCSLRENEPVAMEYFSKGYNVFVLVYSVKEKATDFTPLKELSATLMTIRKNKEEWNCIEDKIAVCGFSAGGHLAASLSTLWNNETFLKYFDNEGGLNKPNTVILSYAVLNSINLEGLHTLPEFNDEARNGCYFDLVEQVSKDNTPAFLWHTFEDDLVPAQNSLDYASKLNENAIPFELHVFPSGGHGISVCTSEVNTEDKHNRQWVKLSVNYLNKFFDYKL